MTPIDAGPLVALLNASDAGHARCLAALPALPAPLITTWPCFTEAMYLLRREAGYPAQEQLWAYVADGLPPIHAGDAEEQRRMRALMAQFRDTPMDLADASLVAAAESLRLRRVFTLDRHFYAYRTADGKPLEVVP